MSCNPAGNNRAQGVIDGRIDPRDIQPNGAGRGRGGRGRGRGPRGGGVHGYWRGGSYQADNTRPPPFGLEPTHLIPTVSTKVRELQEALVKKDSALENLEQACKASLSSKDDIIKQKDDIIKQRDDVIKQQNETILKMKDDRIAQLEQESGRLIAQTGPRVSSGGLDDSSTKRRREDGGDDDNSARIAKRFHSDRANEQPSGWTSWPAGVDSRRPRDQSGGSGRPASPSYVQGGYSPQRQTGMQDPPPAQDLSDYPPSRRIYHAGARPFNAHRHGDQHPSRNSVNTTMPSNASAWDTSSRDQRNDTRNLLSRPSLPSRHAPSDLRNHPQDAQTPRAEFPSDLRREAYGMLSQPSNHGHENDGRLGDGHHDPIRLQGSAWQPDNAPRHPLNGLDSEDAEESRPIKDEDPSDGSNGYPE